MEHSVRMGGRSCAALEGKEEAQCYANRYLGAAIA